MTTPVLQASLEAKVGKLDLRVELDTQRGPLVIVGPNGAGKSSILLLLLGALRPSAGSIRVGDALLFDHTGHVDVALEARRLGYVPQHYALLRHLSVRGNIDFALDCMQTPLSSHERHTRIESLLSELQLSAIADQRASTLSGGEQQRVALARALAVHPRALLLDEPLAALDVGTRRSTRAFLAAYLSKLGVPSVVVTHDAADARTLGSQILVVEAGRVVQRGTWAELVEKPATLFVRELVES